MFWGIVSGSTCKACVYLRTAQHCSPSFPGRSPRTASRSRMWGSAGCSCSATPEQSGGPRSGCQPALLLLLEVARAAAAVLGPFNQLAVLQAVHCCCCCCCCHRRWWELLALMLWTAAAAVAAAIACSSGGSDGGGAAPAAVMGAGRRHAYGWNAARGLHAGGSANAAVACSSATGSSSSSGGVWCPW
jgi:hypothetical protein